MKVENVLIVCMSCVIVLGLILLAIEKKLDQQAGIEYAKIGLIQKYDEKAYRVIWVKP